MPVDGCFIDNDYSGSRPGDLFFMTDYCDRSFVCVWRYMESYCNDDVGTIMWNVRLESQNRKEEYWY